MALDMRWKCAERECEMDRYRAGKDQVDGMTDRPFPLLTYSTTTITRTSRPSNSVTITTITKTRRLSYSVDQKQLSKKKLQQTMDSEGFIDGRCTFLSNSNFNKEMS